MRMARASDQEEVLLTGPCGYAPAIDAAYGGRPSGSSIAQPQLQDCPRGVGILPAGDVRKYRKV